MSGKLTLVKGDATTPILAEDEYGIIPHVCNNAGGWGAGFVMALSKKWPEPESQYRLGHQKGYTQLGANCIVNVAPGLYVANMVAQHSYKSADNPRPLKYDALVCAMAAVREEAKTLAKTAGKVSIHCPKFGSDLAGGNWDFITCLIEDIWLEAGIDVTVYEYDG